MGGAIGQAGTNPDAAHAATGAAVPAASFIWLLFQHDAVYSGSVSSDGAITEVVPWIPGLQLDLAFRMDALARFNPT